MNDKQEFQEFCTILSKCDNKLLPEFLHDIFTPNEIRTLCQRWRLIKLLAKGKTQREIARTLKISLCKITRGSRELKKKNSSFVKALKIHKQIS
jgi:TrpR family trp operon transcriptional repressor